jgi:arylsulfatase
LPTGKVKIEVESRNFGTGHVKAIDVVIRVNGQEVAKGRVPRNAPIVFTANDSFDVGMDSYSPFRSPTTIAPRSSSMAKSKR